MEDPAEPTVFVVDDDPDMRHALSRLFESLRQPVESHESAESFLRAGRSQSPGCLLLDVRMPGMDGMELLAHLTAAGSHLPVILITGYGDIPMVLQAMKSGAMDFIEKPANPQRLIEVVRRALQADRERRRKTEEAARFRGLLANLSEREREVLERMVDGESNKVIARVLGISDKTVEKHRHQVMQKMQADSLGKLIRDWLLNELQAPPC